jgi:hypothetical protein
MRYTLKNSVTQKYCTVYQLQYMLQGRDKASFTLPVLSANDAL